MKIVVVVILSLLHLAGFSQNTIACSDDDKNKLTSYLLRLQDSSLQAMPFSARIGEIGSWFLMTPYVPHTLEHEDGEKLVINLQGLDCTTYLENIVSLSLLSVMRDTSFGDFANMLESIRYRSGVLDQYPSRLHYFSEWLEDNEQKGLLDIITDKLGGEQYAKEINFMSTHRSSYPALVNDQYFHRIKEIEQSVNTKDRFYIPKANVAHIEDQLEEGDLIAITTPIKGLDVVHVGFVKKVAGKTHLLHASSQHKKVEISKDPLSEYLSKNKSQSGIMVARLNPKHNLLPLKP